VRPSKHLNAVKITRDPTITSRNAVSLPGHSLCGHIDRRRNHDTQAKSGTAHNEKKLSKDKSKPTFQIGNVVSHTIKCRIYCCGCKKCIKPFVILHYK
ncbi:hypothetical protein L9F63_011612, partial [Diploptera punctata]